MSRSIKRDGYTDTIKAEIKNPYKVFDILNSCKEVEWKLEESLSDKSMENTDFTGYFINEIVIPLEHSRRKYFSNNHWKVHAYNKLGKDQVIVERHYKEIPADINNELSSDDPLKYDLPAEENPIRFMEKETDLKVKGLVNSLKSIRDILS